MVAEWTVVVRGPLSYCTTALLRMSAMRAARIRCEEDKTECERLYDVEENLCERDSTNLELHAVTTKTADRLRTQAAGPSAPSTFAAHNDNQPKVSKSAMMYVLVLWLTVALGKLSSGYLVGVSRHLTSNR